MISAGCDLRCSYEYRRTTARRYSCPYQVSAAGRDPVFGKTDAQVAAGPCSSAVLCTSMYIRVGCVQVVTQHRVKAGRRSPDPARRRHTGHALTKPWGLPVHIITKSSVGGSQAESRALTTCTNGPCGQQKRVQVAKYRRRTSLSLRHLISNPAIASSAWVRHRTSPAQFLYPAVETSSTKSTSR